MENLRCDVCVIGAGSGGLSVAYSASQMGAKVVLVEGGEMGGDCLNYGCVPSKALIAAASHAHMLGTGGPFGVVPATAKVDFAAVRAHVKNVIASIAPVDSQERYEALGVRVIRAWARFVSPTDVEAGETRITARRFVIATGSKPLIPPIPGLQDVPYLTNETVFDLAELPGHLVIIGGGPIGLELAQACRRIGAGVTVLEAGRVLPREDPDAALTVLDALRAEGVTVRETAPAERVTATGAGICVDAPGGAVTGTHLLVAAGREVDLSRLGLADGGVAFDSRGVTVDSAMRSSNRRVYAIGDAAGGAQFTHLANYHAGLVVRQMLFGLPASLRADHIPRVTYTEPELAQVGLTEAEARTEHGGRLEVLRFPYAENDRARAERRTEGFIKVFAVRGRPVGVTIVGAQAGELIQIWSLAMANRLKLAAIANMVAPYPTLGEIGKRAAGAYFVPRLFENAKVKRIVRGVQRLLP
ncbi:MAG: FAD-dependent oxidoreductase [Rhodobacteraceae bacterium]|nr:FAD-dependent oxidoreductase [Paracoccaceae bacterium]